MPVHHFDRPQGRTVELSVTSDALKANLLGDPATRTVAVYLPPGYDESDRDYPLMVDLAGFTGSGLKRLAWTAFGQSVPQRVDRLVAEGKMGPAIFAFPDAFTTLGGNQYVDSIAMGHWERFLADDMLPQLESQFRIRPGREHRAVFGKSSGGYGALVQGMRHADLWSAIACHSGDMGFEWLYMRDFPPTLDVLARHGHDVVRFLAHVRDTPKLGGHEMHALMILAMAATYDPDETGPMGIRLPVDTVRCALIPERWQRWLAHDPVRMIEDPRCQDNLGSLDALVIDCGRRDQYFLHYGARQLTHRLGELGIEHVYEEFDDNHSNIDYRLDTSLPRLFAAIDRG